MDGAINFFNVEIGVFLRYLHYFSNIECVKINNQTSDLLRITQQKIDNLLETAEMVMVSEAADINFLFELDEHRYELQRCICCHDCNKMINLSRIEFDEHESFHDKIDNQLQSVNSSCVTSMNNLSMSSQSQSDIKMANTTMNDDQFDQSGNHDESIEDQRSDSDEQFYEISNMKFTDVVVKTDTHQTSASQSFEDNNDSLTSKKTSESSSSSSSSIKSIQSNTYYVKMRGLPWAATKKEIQSFFSNVKIHNGLDGIHFITDDQSNVGVAFVEFSTKKQLESALLYHKKKLDERYIEVLKANETDILALSKCDVKNDDYILRLEGLPWNANEDNIRKFFHGLKLSEVHLIKDKITNHTLEAFVRFTSIDDYDAALKHNWHLMGIRHIKIFRCSEKQMNIRIQTENADVKPSINQTSIQTNHMDIENFPSLPTKMRSIENVSQPEEWQRVANRKIDKKTTTLRTYKVIARGFQWKVTKKDVIEFFKGINIVDGENGINIVKNIAMEAHVVLASKIDRKKALALNGKHFEGRAITVTEINTKHQMDSGPVVNASKTSPCKIIQIRGLPWSVDKDYVMKLFAGMTIDYETGIQIEQDENQRRTGFAFVKFDKINEYDKAFKLDLKHINPYLKLFKATKEQFDRTAAANKMTENATLQHCNEFQQHFPVIGRTKKHRS